MTAEPTTKPSPDSDVASSPPPAVPAWTDADADADTDRLRSLVGGG